MLLELALVGDVSSVTNRNERDERLTCEIERERLIEVEQGNKKEISNALHKLDPKLGFTTLETAKRGSDIFEK